MPLLSVYALIAFRKSFLSAMKHTLIAAALFAAIVNANAAGYTSSTFASDCNASVQFINEGRTYNQVGAATCVAFIRGGCWRI